MALIVLIKLLFIEKNENCPVLEAGSKAPVLWNEQHDRLRKA